MNDVIDDVALRQHDPFRVAGGAGGVDDGSEVLLLGSRQFGGRRFGAFFLQEFAVKRAVAFFSALGAQIFQRENHQRHGGQLFQFVPVFLADKDSLAAGMADDVTDIVFRKAGQDRHRYRRHGGDREIGDGPVGTVVPQQSDAISRFHAQRGQFDGEGGHRFLQLSIGDGFFIEKSQTRQRGVQGKTALHEMMNGHFFNVDDHTLSSTWGLSYALMRRGPAQDSGVWQRSEAAGPHSFVL
ncbi:MAG: hypothetical protein BWY83_02248 [bacterium ADurb.Bin478]|nr:MAG: hypothetical protein BWY83_02248 [bacterium ADurb.Bin478]